MNWETLRVVVTGGAGFLGRVLCAKLTERGCRHVLVPQHSAYELTQADAVERMYHDLQPDVVFHLAAEVGGIGANRKRPGRFFYANMAMGLNLIEQARKSGLKKFIHTGTVCAYPKFTPVPFQESNLWNGYPEETNAPYGVAKKALFVMLDAYQQEYGLESVVVVPVNLYGPGDNFDSASSHVIPALIRKCVEAVQNQAPSITCWGTGQASREFLYVDDAAEAIIRAAERLSKPVPINIGTGSEISIRELVQLIAAKTGFGGAILWDDSHPDGQPRRCLDVSRAKVQLDWHASVSFETGLQKTIDWYTAHQS